MRSHVVFKLLNYVADKIVRVALTSACVQTASMKERARGIENVFSVHNKTSFCGKNMEMICCFYPIVDYIYLFGQCRCGFWLFCC